MRFTSFRLEEVKKLLGQSPVYSLDFNLDGRGRPTDGVCAVTEKELVIINGQKVNFRCSLDEIGEYTTTQLVGSGAFGIIRNGEPIQLCIFTQDLLNSFAELGKLLDYHRETGIFPEPGEDDNNIRICPKCGSIIPEGTNICFHCEKKGKIPVESGTAVSEIPLAPVGIAVCHHRHPAAVDFVPVPAGSHH